jgi:hypothetical protein
MTLDELKADYEAKRHALLSPFIREPDDWARWDDTPHLASPEGAYADEYKWKAHGTCRWDDYHDEPEVRQRGLAMYRAASLYLIARDHGLPAAMLYKLSGGEMDPRSN